MSKFTDFVSIRPLPWINKWTTSRELEFYIDKEDGEKIVVPCGFVFDWCSIPRFLWIFAPPVEPKTISSGALHDYLIRNHKWLIFANNMFYRWLKANKVSLFKRVVFYIWVTLGAWIPYYLNK